MCNGVEWVGGRERWTDAKMKMGTSREEKVMERVRGGEMSIGEGSPKYKWRMHCGFQSLGHELRGC